MGEGVDSGCPQGAGVPRAWTVAVHRGVGTQTRGQWLFTGGVGGQRRGQWLSTAGSGAKGGAWTAAVHREWGGGGRAWTVAVHSRVGGPGAWTAAVHREWGGGRGVDSGCPEGVGG